MLRVRRWCAVVILAAAWPQMASAQIATEDYLRYVTLQQPTIVRQTAATARFNLFGDKADANYRDEAPRDGIDDARAAWLTRLATRFAPVMVLNTEQFPIDFRSFYDRDTFPLSTERWDIVRHESSLIDSDSLDMARLGANPCPAPGANDGDDCRLLRLIETFGPGRTPLDGEGSVPAERNVFPLLHFDMPGFDEKTWKAEYGAQYRQRYAPAARVFAHPFIAEAAANGDAPAGFEFVLQFWFFYPVNDGPNNHEGDWEHINVIVSPLDAISRPLDAAAMERLIAGDAAMDGPQQLVIRRIEYFFHHFVTPIDFSTPNAYQPRAQWERDAQVIAKARGTDTDVLKRVRARAWKDEAETIINTRPIVWIGGDGIGIQNVLETPGLKDRDGHASYPFRGYYKRIGAASVGERVIREFDHVKYFANPAAEQHAEDYGDPAKIALTPDWELVRDLVREDAGVRRDWSWLVLPVHYGYPASPSPAAGIIPHADTGNVSVVGPSYNDGWNRIGDTPGYETYSLVEVSWARPLNVQDSFFPGLGFLNAPILYFMIKPPLDLAWRTVALPVRAAVGARQPTFFPENAPASRSISFEAGMMTTDLSDSLVALFLTREQLPEILTLTAVKLALGGGEGQIALTPRFGWASAPTYALGFHLSPRFSTESTLVVYDGTVGFDATQPGLAQPIETRGTFHQFEYQGVLRFNLSTGTAKPYVKYGNGLTWYQLRDVNVDGIPLTSPDSPKFRPKSGWRSLGFNETIFGAGLDWQGKQLGRTWLGFKGSYTYIHHALGFEKQAFTELDDLAAELAGTVTTISRHQFRAMATFGF